jgi:uncharacterized protein (UPF0210 family)
MAYGGRYGEHTKRQSAEKLHFPFRMGDSALSPTPGRSPVVNAYVPACVRAHI